MSVESLHTTQANLSVLQSSLQWMNIHLSFLSSPNSHTASLEEVEQYILVKSVEMLSSKSGELARAFIFIYRRGKRPSRR